MPPHFVYEMDQVCRSYGDKEVLRDISLSFFYGAKIGVIGENGSGKSTLLKIMAGLDQDYQGSTKLAPKMKVRYIAQEPVLELDKTVRENLRTAIKDTLDMIDRFNEISEQLCDPAYEDKMEKLLAEMGVLQDRIDACDGWQTDRLMDMVSDAMVLPPDDSPIKQLSGGERRRVALCMALLEKP
ncbi:MAG: ATP-binding cassette domain-containing protein, partial [Anaerohalosphaera sp.]|nr:ATP-binding cassette domain-containing protein [Anaerohalosphaera sp.]